MWGSAKIGVTNMEQALESYGAARGSTMDADWEQSFAAQQGADVHGCRAIRRRTV